MIKGICLGYRLTIHRTRLSCSKKKMLVLSRKWDKLLINYRRWHSRRMSRDLGSGLKNARTQS